MPKSYYVHGYSTSTKNWHSKGPMDYEDAERYATGFRKAGYDNVMISTSANPGRGKGKYQDTKTHPMFGK